MVHGTAKAAVKGTMHTRRPMIKERQKGIERCMMAVRVASVDLTARTTGERLAVE